MLKNIEVASDGVINVNPTALVAEAEANLSKPGRKTDTERFERGMRMLQKRHGWWSDDTKTTVVALYVSGVTSPEELERLTHVPAYTIKNWRSQDWWIELAEKVHTTIDQDLVAKQTEIAELALDSIQDRLENGEAFIDRKTGEVKRRPVSMRDANIVANTVVEKRQLLRGKATSRAEKITTDERLATLAKEFERFAKAKDITAESKLLNKEI